MGLGVWQTQRLEWKTDLIETIEARRSAAPVAYPQTVDMQRRDSWEFTRARLSGRFRHDAEMQVLAQTQAGRAGVRLVAPLALDNGGWALVDRGWAPGGGAPVERPEGVVTLEGLLRGPPEGNPFRPANRPEEDVWYWIDPAAMARAAGLPPRAFYVQAISMPTEGPADAGRYPIPGGAALELRNDHLQYALTWFGLAAALLAVMLAWRRRARRRGA